MLENSDDDVKVAGIGKKLLMMKEKIQRNYDGKIILTCENFVSNLFLAVFMLLFLLDDNKIKMARKPGKKVKENPVGSTGEGKE